MLNEHLTASPGGPEDLVFTTREGAPIRQSQFYRRHYKPAIKGDPYNPDPKKRRAPALPERRLHGLRFHDLRHTCAALLIEQGAHALAVKEQLGHSSITITPRDNRRGLAYRREP
jgi:integrase